MAINPESIKVKLQTLFTNNYGTYLDAVEANHTSDPISLEEFDEIVYGDVSSVREMRQWPSLAILSGPTRVFREGEAGFWQFYDTSIELRMFFRHQNLTIVCKFVDRHIEAMIAFLDAYPTLEGQAMEVHNVVFNPAEAIRPPNWTDFAKGLQVAFEVRHKG